MGQYQLLIAAVVIIGVVSYIVASSHTSPPPAALPPLPDHHPQPLRHSPSPLPRKPIATPITSTKATVPPVSAGTSTSTMIMAEQRAYRTLLAKARGDRALVERLITYEQKRDVRGTRLTWIQSANTRWERDNR